MAPDVAVPLGDVRPLGVLFELAEYASRALVDLSQHYLDGPQSIEAIAQRQDIPKKYLEQVLLLLKEEKTKTQDNPELWAYWQLRAGNEVANQLYREGDYIPALSVYLNLAQLDPAPAWQLPVKYQIGLTYERLQQPQKAIDTYNEIVQLEPQVGTNAAPGQKAIFEIARWRAEFFPSQFPAREQLRTHPGEFHIRTLP